MLAAKRVPSVIPFCHSLPLDGCDVEVRVTTACNACDTGVADACPDTPLRQERSAHPRFTPSLPPPEQIHMLHPSPPSPSQPTPAGPGAPLPPPPRVGGDGGSGGGSSGGGSCGGGGRLRITCTARVTGRTGVEMEALAGVTGAALTVYDMVKAAAGKGAAASVPGGWGGIGVAGAVGDAPSPLGGDGSAGGGGGGSGGGGIVIDGIRLLHKAGGRGGEWRAGDTAGSAR